MLKIKLMVAQVLVVEKQEVRNIKITPQGVECFEFKSEKDAANYALDLLVKNNIKVDKVAKIDATVVEGDNTRMVTVYEYNKEFDAFDKEVDATAKMEDAIKLIMEKGTKEEIAKLESAKEEDKAQVIAELLNVMKYRSMAKGDSKNKKKAINSKEEVETLTSKAKALGGSVWKGFCSMIKKVFHVAKELVFGLGNFAKHTVQNTWQLVSVTGQNIWNYAKEECKDFNNDVIKRVKGAVVVEDEKVFEYTVLDTEDAEIAN